MRLVGVVDLLAQVAQADALVLRILGRELRQDAPDGRVFVVVVLELLQGGEQGVPAALGDADSEHDEERVQAALLDDDAMFGHILGDHRGGNAGLVKVAIEVEARGDDGGFDRVEHVEAGGQLAEAVPFVAGFQHPVFA